jgi:hypothetical protein
MTPGDSDLEKTLELEVGDVRREPNQDQQRDQEE